MKKEDENVRRTDGGFFAAEKREREREREREQ